MRIVSGSAGGIPLRAPRHARTDLRPTMEVVKNAIFNSLGESIAGIRVLDLFAGIGGLGIEALSRGASSCVFVEVDRRNGDAIRENLERAKLTGGEIAVADVPRWLSRLTVEHAYELILADPPYAKQPGDVDFTPGLLASEPLHRALTPGGLFILEHLPGAELPLDGRWECLRQKRYGATEVAVLRPIFKTT